MTKRPRQLGDVGYPATPEGYWDRERARFPITPDIVPPHVSPDLATLIEWLRSNYLNVQLPVFQEPSCQDVPLLFYNTVTVTAKPPKFDRIVTFKTTPDSYGVIHSVGTDLDLPGQFGIILWRFVMNDAPMETFESFTIRFGRLDQPQRIKIVVPPGGSFGVEASNPRGRPPVRATAVIHGWRVIGPKGGPTGRFKEIC